MFRNRTFRKHRRPRVRLHTKTDKTFEGVLMEVYGDHYHLLSAKLVVGGAQTVPVDGPLAIPTANVEALEVVVATEVGP